MIDCNVGIIILRQVCVKTGIKQMSVSVCVIKSLGEKKYNARLMKLRKDVTGVLGCVSSLTTYGLI